MLICSLTLIPGHLYNVYQIGFLQGSGRRVRAISRELKMMNKRTLKVILRTYGDEVTEYEDVFFRRRSRYNQATFSIVKLSVMESIVIGTIVNQLLFYGRINQYVIHCIVC